MKLVHLFTAKKGLPCIKFIGYNDLHIGYVIKKDEEFIFHEHTHTVEAFANHEGESDYVDFLLSFQSKKQAALEQAKKQAEERELERITGIEVQIKMCADIDDFLIMFGLKKIDTANHWSDLYEGRSKTAILISNRREFEIVEILQRIHNVSGEFGEAKRRDGEQHSVFYKIYGGLEGYQDSCKKHFYGDKYFYKSKNDEQEFYLERIKEADSIDDVREILKSFDDIEDGTYDCNGNLIISDETLNDSDFTGYYEDVYRYSFAFEFENTKSFAPLTEEE